MIYKTLILFAENLVKIKDARGNSVTSRYFDPESQDVVLMILNLQMVDVYQCSWAVLQEWVIKLYVSTVLKQMTLQDYLKV